MITHSSSQTVPLLIKNIERYFQVEIHSVSNRTGYDVSLILRDQLGHIGGVKYITFYMDHKEFTKWETVNKVTKQASDTLMIDLLKSI